MFSEHGFYDVHHDGSIVIFAATGAWNLEASRKAIDAISQHVDMMAEQEFAIIADTSEVEGLTPDSAKAWHEAIDIWFNKGYTAFARVDEPESVYYKVYLAKFDEFARENQKFGLFDSVPEALLWLHDKGFNGFHHGPPAVDLVKGDA